MADPKVKFKRSSVPGKIPNETQVPLGEIALNTYDGKVFASKNVGIGTTVFVVNPWNVGTGTDAYDINFIVGNVGVGSTLPSSKLSVVGDGKFTGIVTATGGFNLGISSAGIPITSGPLTTLNFIGAGNTFALNGTTLDVSISAAGAATVAISTVAPSSPSPGDLWYNSVLGRTFVYYDDGSSSQWVDTAPFHIDSLQGASGSQGIQGNAGIQGSQGVQGLSNQGVQGTQGVEGSQGAQGVQGLSNQGVQGTQGTQGTQGLEGSQGAQGIQGTQGVQGEIGLQGVQGLSNQGVQGTIGIQGDLGTQGSQGVQGLSNQGVQGTQGAISPVAGSANQVVYKDGSNVATGSTNLTFNGTELVTYDLTVLRNTDINGNLNVDGTITIGGTAAQLNTQQLTVVDADIVLGIGTSFSPTDATASHGGIAIASTEGTPLVSLAIGGETNPDTYKKIMWFRGGDIGAGYTDAWLFNYGVGIGSTQVPNGVRLAVENIQFTQNDLSAVRNVNASGIITATGGFNLGISSAGSVITSGPVKTLNFVGSGNTFAVNGTTVDISISGGGGGAVSISSIAPSLPGNGDLWYSTEYGRTFVYYDEVALGIGSTAVWVDAAPFNNTIQGIQGSQGIQGGLSAQGIAGVNYDKSVTTYIATANQTTFSVTYSAGFVDVFLNGIRLSSAEYTATNGTSVVLTTGASAGDVVDLIAYTGGSLGAQGTQGTQGVQGGLSAQGTSGTQGTQGVQGLSNQGVQGTQGLQGTQGVQGLQGTQGLVGTSAVSIINDTTTNATYYVGYSTVTSGTLSTVGISTSKLTFNPSTGQLTAVDFNSTSDQNLKDNVESLSNSIEILEQINPVKFTWKDNGNISYGVIAQELEEILPELVKNDTNYKSVSYIPLIAMLIDAVKVHQEEIENLKSKLNI